MKSILSTFLLLLFSYGLSAQKNNLISIGTKEVISSKVLKEDRTIWIYTPSLTNPSTSSKPYPVLYLLDGEAHFYSTVGILQQMSQANGNGALPEMIVVAIGNTNRMRDFTPSVDVKETNPFVEFLSSELIPYIDKNYNTAPYRVLLGHSLGGLMAIDLLANKKDLFNAYISIDPSMWYYNEVFLKNAMDQFAKQKMNGKKLFIGTANTMPKGMSLAQLKKDSSPETQHIRSIFKFDEFLKTNSNGLLYAHKYYESERHNTVPLPAEYDGLRFIFDYYFLDLNEKDFADTSALIASTLKNHYALVSEKMGYKNAAPEALINYLGYDALTKKQWNKSKQLFLLNTEWYPESMNACDSYADYFLAQKDTLNAIVWYEKALLIKTDGAISTKLNALRRTSVWAPSAEDLQKYAGIYTLVDFNLDMALKLRKGSLWAIVPGQADGELQAIAENVFTLKGQQGYTITFEMNDGNPKSFTSVQPNGTFKAVYKHK